MAGFFMSFAAGLTYCVSVIWVLTATAFTSATGLVLVEGSRLSTVFFCSTFVSTTFESNLEVAPVFDLSSQFLEEVRTDAFGSSVLGTGFAATNLSSLVSETLCLTSLVASCLLATLDEVLCSTFGVGAF